MDARNADIFNSVCSKVIYNKKNPLLFYIALSVSASEQYITTPA
jgi:hypothetical protein